MNVKRLSTVLALSLLGLLLGACGRVADDASVPFAGVTTSAFSDFAATLDANAAEFSFAASGSGSYRIDLSTVADMSTDVYVAFGAGTSPVVVVDPQARWDKYVCGVTLYWRVVDNGNGDTSAIQSATVCPVNPFGDLSAAFNSRQANFTFHYAGNSPQFTVTASTRPDMSTDIVGTVSGNRSPLRVVNPEAAWPGYRCGVVLYWRVTDGNGASSPIQEKHVCGHVGFSAERASLTADHAVFEFRYRGVTDHFRVDMSTLADMSRDVYVGFGTGRSSPVVVADPQARWDKVVCGATLYWRVHELLNGRVGDIHTVVVECPNGP